MTPTYPDSTKTLSVNYTVAGTQFAIADADPDILEPEDIWRLQQATEEHTHDTGRGLPVRRIDAASTPTAPGHITVTGDDFRWWGATTGIVVAAVNTGADQTIGGTKRFTNPLLLPRQVSDPPAPGVGLGLLYLGANDRLYLRSGSNPGAPVGTPGMMVPGPAWKTTQGTGQALLQQVTLGGDFVDVLTYRSAGNDLATLTTVIPSNYGGTPITIYVTWTVTPASGGVNWTMLTKVTPPDQAFTAAGTEVAQQTLTVAAGGASLHKRTTLVWNTGLPQPGDVVTYALKRDDAKEVAAGTRFPGDAYMLNVALVYG